MSQDNNGQAQAAETLTQETRTFIRQVMTNLLSNAVKYAPTGSGIGISVAEVWRQASKSQRG